MAVVDLGNSVQKLFLSQALELKSKIDTATAQAKGTAIKGVTGYYIGTGIVTAGAFSIVMGLGLILGGFLGESPIYQGVGLMIAGILIVGLLVAGALIAGKAPKPAPKAP